MAWRRGALLVALAVQGAAGEALTVNEGNWDKEVTKRVENGQFVFAKFLASWCGHCKKLKPDWDKLGEKFNYKTNAHIVDVDCTLDDSKKLCETYGVEGYPTLKYFGPGLASDGEKYEESREYGALSKFVKKKAKKPCVPDTLENCDKKDQKFLEEIKDFDAEKLQAEKDRMDKEISELAESHKETQALFEKQKEEAVATMKQAEELKKKLSKLQGKNGYKLLILKAKTAGKEKTEL